MRLHPSQIVAFATLGIFVGGVAIAGHYDAQRRGLPAVSSWNTSDTTARITRPRDELTPVSNPGPPMTLTASDGTGLSLVKLEGRAVVSDPLAFTELHLVFANPRDRVIEGNFSITLPQGATVSRFAMKLADSWQEGEMVEKQAARRAYEDFLHKKQDPALLEQGAGNAFTARVFPIPARGTKELIVSYTQELTGRAPYALPLLGLPEIGAIDVAVSLAGDPAPVALLKDTKLVPKSDFVFDTAKLKPTPGLRSGNLVLARVQPMPDDAPDPVSSAVILFDTSASRALGFNDQIDLLGKVVRELSARSGGDLALTVACFDQTTAPMFSGKASAFGEAELAKIRSRGALGASNLEQALSWAKEQAKAHGDKRVVLVTDGVPTAGEAEADKLGVVAATLKDAGVLRLDAITVGGIRDDALLHRLATAGLAHDGVVLDGRIVAPSLARRLNDATRSGIAVTVEGASWSFPTTLDGVQAGDEYFVYADVPEQSPVRVTVGGAAMGLDLQHVERPLLERAWVQAKIGSVLARERVSGPTAATKQEIVDLSLRYRVMSPYTSLLVLETDADYARFGIDRNSLAEILVVEDGSLALRKRGEEPKNEAKKNKQDEKEANQDFKAAPPKQVMAVPTGMATTRTMATTTAMATATAMPTAMASGAPPPDTAEKEERDRDGEDRAPGSPAPSVAATSMARAPVVAPRAIGPSSHDPDVQDLSNSATLEGGGGAGDAVGLGAIGTTGHGAGTGTGQGFGNGHGRLGGARQTRPPSLVQGAVTVNGALPVEVLQRIVRQNFGRFRLCYEQGLTRNPTLAGRVTIRFGIDPSGAVSHAEDGGSQLPDSLVIDCVARSFLRLSFPQPDNGTVNVVYPMTFSPGEGGVGSDVADQGEMPAAADPYTGNLKTVMAALAKHDTPTALAAAQAWNRETPGDVLAFVALGEVYEAMNDNAQAERAYGSIIDLFSSRADLRRFAGERLDRIHDDAALDLALDTYAKAAAERPDHPASHRLLAFAWLKKGNYEKAFQAGLDGRNQKYPAGRFDGVDRILREDLGLLAAAWIKAEPARTSEILDKLQAADGKIENGPSIRFVLNWETDANDVDFHIFDDRGGHAYYAAKSLPSGGDLYADVTTGYGPECFTIRGNKANRAAKYTLQANYYSRGPMGYGMGKLEIIEHDGKGGLTFEERPFVVMTDHAFVDLGTVKR